jgi:hypothetical protein
MYVFLWEGHSGEGNRGIFKKVIFLWVFLRSGECGKICTFHEKLDNVKNGGIIEVTSM